MPIDKWRDFAPGASAPATWPDGIESLLGNYVSPNFSVVRSGSNTVNVLAGTTNGDQRTIAIQGSPRWITSPVSATHPGGGAGVHDIWACCTADSFGSSSGPPPQETDTTTRSFTLKITTAGTPSGSGGEALFRRIGTLVWDGSQILSVVPLLGIRPVFEIGHTWAVAGEVRVPSGFADVIPAIWVPVLTGQTVKVKRVHCSIDSGTSATFKLQLGGTDISGLTGIVATTTGAGVDVALATPLALNNNSQLRPVVTAVSATPINLSVTAVLEHS